MPWLPLISMHFGYCIVQSSITLIHVSWLIHTHTSWHLDCFMPSMPFAHHFTATLLHCPFSIFYNATLLYTSPCTLLDDSESNPRFVIWTFCWKRAQTLSQVHTTSVSLKEVHYYDKQVIHGHMMDHRLTFNMLDAHRWNNPPNFPHTLACNKAENPTYVAKFSLICTIFWQWRFSILLLKKNNNQNNQLNKEC